MKYKLVERANPQKREEKKWYANAINTGTVNQKEIAKNISEKSALTIGDIGSTIQNLIEELPKELVQGKSVNLEGLGTFRLSLSSEGAATEKDFNANMINSVKIIFTPSVEIKKILENIKFERG